MSRSPLHSMPGFSSQDHHSARSAIGPPKLRRGRGLLLAFCRRCLIVILCLAAGLAVGDAVIQTLPNTYMAETRLLIPAIATPDQQIAAFRSHSIAQSVIGELHLAGDAAFNSPLQPLALLDFADWWLRDRIGVSPPEPRPAPGGDPLDRNFWSHVELSRLGNSSRILSIRAFSPDPNQAAAIANALARHQPIGGSLLAPATVPTQSYFPPVDMTLTLGGLAGAVIGVFLAWSFGGSRRDFRHADEIESATGLPVIALVPQLADGRNAIAHVLRNPLSPFTESLRQLHVRLQAPDWATPPKIVAIASALPGEGRSTLAASLGRLLSGDGKRVLLIDCDWRHPDLHRLFRLPNDYGLTSLLVDEHADLDDVIQTDALSGLDIITTGRRNRKAQRMLLTDRMRILLAEFAQNYDLVLLDMPPVQTANEVLLLSRLANQVIFAVRWRHTRRKLALNAAEQILGVEGEVAGIVFTRVDLDRYRRYQRHRSSGALRRSESFKFARR